MAEMTVLQWVSAAGTVMQMAGSMSQADNMRAAAAANAENARRAAEANNIQLQAAATAKEAESQHRAEKSRAEARLLASRALAIGAASGGGVDHNLIDGILTRGDTQAGYDLYGGTEAAKGLRYRGEVGIATANNQGRQNIIEANNNADATIMGGIGRAAIAGLSAFAPSAPPTLASLGGTSGANGYSYYGAD